KGGEIVPYVDVRAAGPSREIGAEPGDGRGAALEPHQRVDEAVVPDAHEVGAVVGQERRRGDDATEGSGEIGEPGGADHPDDAHPDLRPPRRLARGRVVVLALLEAGQLESERVADAL